MGIVIPPRTDPNTGQTVFTTEANYNDLLTRYNANQAFQQSFGQGIPGMNGTAYGGYAGIPLPGQGLLGGGGGMPPSRIPTQPGLPPQQQQQMPFAAPGSYGRQAMQMAGVLSSSNPPGDTYPNGLLGGGKRRFIPGGK